MKQLLIFIFCMNTLCVSAQSVITSLKSDMLPDEVRSNLKNLSVNQIEAFKQSGKTKIETHDKSVKIKYDLKIEDNNLIGIIESNEGNAAVNIKLVWHCDHNPQHIATSKEELKQNTQDFNCKNWSSD